MSALGQKQTYALQQAMSALPPKADMCGALAHVRFGPKADMTPLIRSPRQRGLAAGGTARPSALAVLRLIASSYLVGVCTGRSEVFRP
jgi:hypothetical protein